MRAPCCHPVNTDKFVWPVGGHFRPKYINLSTLFQTTPAKLFPFSIQNGKRLNSCFSPLGKTPLFQTKIPVYCKWSNKCPRHLFNVRGPRRGVKQIWGVYNVRRGIYFTLTVTTSTKQIIRVVCSQSKIENRVCEWKTNLICANTKPRHVVNSSCLG